MQEVNLYLIGERVRRLYFKLEWHDGTTWQNITVDVISASVQLELNEKTDKLIAKVNGTKNWNYNQRVALYADANPNPTTRIFYGYIEKIEVEERSGRGRHHYPVSTIHCVDYTERLLQKIVVESYRDKTVGAIVKDLVEKYLPGEITTDGVEDDGTVVQDIRFPYQPLSTCLQQLRQIPKSGPHAFYIDIGLDVPDLKFFLQQQEEPTVLTIDDSIVKEYKFYGDYTNVKNVILLKGGVDYYVDKSQSTALTVAYATKDYYYADDFVPEQPKLSRIKLYVSKVGSPTVNLTGKIRKDVSGSPTGVIVKEFSVDYTRITTEMREVDIDIGEEYLISGSTYWIVIDKVGDANNYYNIYGDGTGAMKRSTDGSTWSSIAGSLNYKTLYGKTVLSRAGTAPSSEERVHMIVSDLISRDTARLMAQTTLANLLVPEKQLDVTIDPVVGLTAGKFVEVQLSNIPSWARGKGYLIWSVTYIFGEFMDCYEIRLQIAKSQPPMEFQEVVRKLKDQLYQERLKALGLDTKTVLDVVHYFSEKATITETFDQTNANYVNLRSATYVPKIGYGRGTLYDSRIGLSSIG